MIIMTAATIALAMKMQELAYVSGRCRHWFNDAQAESFEPAILSNAELTKTYEQGRADAEKEGIRFSDCRNMISDLSREIRAETAR